MVVQPRRSHRVSRWTHLLLVGLALLLPCAVARGADRERPDGEGRARAEGDRKEGDRKEGDRKEGDRKEGDRKEGDRKEGDRKEGDRKEGDRKKGDRKEGDRKEGDRKEGGEVEKPRMRVFGGEITKADGKSVTVLRRGDSGESSQTFAITRIHRFSCKRTNWKSSAKAKEVKRRSVPSWKRARRLICNLASESRSGPWRITRQ